MSDRLWAVNIAEYIDCQCKVHGLVMNDEWFQDSLFEVSPGISRYRYNIANLDKYLMTLATSTSSATPAAPAAAMHAGIWMLGARGVCSEVGMFGVLRIYIRCGYSRIAACRLRMGRGRRRRRRRKIRRRGRRREEEQDS